MEAADLMSIPLFATLSVTDRARVAEAARREHFDVGHVVVNEGEFPFDFYAISRGAAEVRRAGNRVASLGPGDFFGEAGVLPDGARRSWQRRSASVVITEPTDVVAIGGTDLRCLAEAIPTLRDALRATAAQRSTD